jgi:transcriptional regulator with XRE-family HTH domain
MENLADLLGERIRIRREMLGMTRADLSNRTGISEDALGLIERGENCPRIENLLRLAQVLRVAVEVLLKQDGLSPRGRSVAMDRLIACLNGRSEEEIRMVCRIARQVLSQRAERRRGRRRQ